MLTELLDIAFETGGPAEGFPVLLLHGWPDAVRGWRTVTPGLERAGYRWIAPSLRGFGGTRFRAVDTVRDGTAAALATDAFNLMDQLGIRRFAVIGHDWGGRAAYVMSALAPERLACVAVLGIGYAPRGRFVVPSFEQSQRWWYQWYLTVDGAAEAFRKGPIGFARRQWDSWSPQGWFDDREFHNTAMSFANPDWVDITLHGYRSRWRSERLDPRYDEARARIEATEKLSVPTLMIHGARDYCDPPAESEGLGRYFEAQYERVVIDKVGHFPAREAPAEVTRLVLQCLARHHGD